MEQITETIIAQGKRVLVFEDRSGSIPHEQVEEFKEEVRKAMEIKIDFNRWHGEDPMTDEQTLGTDGKKVPNHMHLIKNAEHRKQKNNRRR